MSCDFCGKDTQTVIGYGGGKVCVCEECLRVQSFLRQKKERPRYPGTFSGSETDYVSEI